MIHDVRDLVADGRPDARWRSPTRCSAIPTRSSSDVSRRASSPTTGHPALARAHLRGLPPATWARLAPAEYVRSGLAPRPDEALAGRQGAGGRRPAGRPARALVRVLAAVFGYGDQEIARAVFAVFDRHSAGTCRAGRRDRCTATGCGPGSTPTPTRPPLPPRRTAARCSRSWTTGIPGANRASANIGDHVQSIASARPPRAPPRRPAARDAELVDLLTTLRDRARPEFARDDLHADLEVMTVHRDASIYQPIPEGTWVLCFGWYMHALFTLRHGFPLHRNLRPIFVSFHCNKRNLLTPDAIDYLKRYGPVGCRDWTTTHLLASMGVPAFFSGCVTTTIGRVFPDAPAPRADAPVAYVDVPEESLPADAVTYAPQLARGPPALVHRQRHDRPGAPGHLPTRASRVVTSRLHCHLPLRSIGVQTEFVPANPADVRFDGLIDISDQQFDAIRSGITEKLERVLRPMIAGEPEDDVYAAWRARPPTRSPPPRASCAAPRTSPRAGGQVGRARPRRGRRDEDPPLARRRDREPPWTVPCSSPATATSAAPPRCSTRSWSMRPAGPAVGPRAAGQPGRPAGGRLPGGDHQLDRARPLGTAAASSAWCSCPA